MSFTYSQIPVLFPFFFFFFYNLYSPVYFILKETDNNGYIVNEFIYTNGVGGAKY